MFGKVEEDMSFTEKLKKFLAVHWRGVICVVTPLILISVLTPFPAEKHQWVAFTLLLMAVFWVTEAIPLAVTSFFPVMIFPLMGVTTTTEVCKSYVNDTIMMFLGSLFLAYAIEQSGLHKRLAYGAIRVIGYSHLKLLLTVCSVTCFVSMWVTNTAATTMMVPMNFAVLKVFDSNGICKMYEKSKTGDKIASDIMTAYFCAASFSATIGGVGTLVGTVTNLAFKGLFTAAYPDAPEYLSFPLFSAFGVPYMIVMLTAIYLSIAIQFFGFLRPGSPQAKAAVISKKGIELAEKAIKEDSDKMGKFSFWEGMVLILFSSAMILFFSRSPQIFPGWADSIREYFEIKDTKYIRDSAVAMLVVFAMLALPSTLAFFTNCKAKYYNELPKGRITSVLDWPTLNTAMPYSFIYLLGGGFALSDAASTSGLNKKIGESLGGLKDLPNMAVIFIMIILVVFITNFGSNVAVANVMVPLAMQLAKEIKRNPLWYCIVCGFSASYCLMLPVGTPGNLIVQSAASIPTDKMMRCGAIPTVAVIIITWLFMCFYAPVIWPDIEKMPDWIG